MAHTSIPWNDAYQLGLQKRLYDYAAAQPGGGVSVAQVCRAALEEYLDKHEQPETQCDVE